MKKLVNFLLFILLLLTMFGMVFVASAIYDTTPKITVDTFFFQPQRDYESRISEPTRITDFTPTELRDILLQKYLTEYFYVIPDEQNVNIRQSGQTALRFMSSSRVFSRWLENIAPEIAKMADEGMLRTVKLISAQETPTDTNGKPYWRVEYELTTWAQPNDFLTAPTTTRGILFMQISFTPQLMKTVRGRSVYDYLETGNDPAAVFSFGIMDIAQEL